MNELWQLLNEMAIYLLIGFLFGGILHVLIPKERVSRYLGRKNTLSVMNATLLGIPLPLCSCGVVPAGISFYRNGASKGATTSFLISAPQTAVDPMLVTYSLLGLPMALIYLIL
ncbi:permease [Prolixibacter sp. SD074]|uniref:permease n=1 Tax=Prolixibacter sp. SD074 TaxID=2652391 RepID=UPI00188DF35A|nr:permease [Prolixibacter sp. SD074]